MIREAWQVQPGVELCHFLGRGHCFKQGDI